MKLLIVGFGEGLDLKFKVLFNCSVCKKEVEPEKLLIGKAHVYALHCGTMQDVGCILFLKRAEYEA